MGMPSIPQQAQLPGDAVVAGGLVAFWLGYIPTILGVVVSILSIVWLTLQIWTWWRKRCDRT
jgi:hypothetical protein